MRAYRQKTPANRSFFTFTGEIRYGSRARSVRSEGGRSSLPAALKDLVHRGLHLRGTRQSSNSTTAPKQGEAGARATTAVTRGSRSVASGSRNAQAETSQPATRLPLLRNSERGAAKSCEFKWHLTYNLRLRPHSDAPALRFGSLVHRALAQWYVPGVKRGQHPRIGFEKAYEEDLKRNQSIFQIWLEDEKRIDAHELGVAMMDNYVDEYGQDDEWEVIVTEHPFQSEAGGFFYVGVIDGVWRHRPTKHYYIPDHKTTAGIGGTKKHPKIPPHLLMDDQAGGYWSFGVLALKKQGLIPKNIKLHGMIYNYLRKAMPDERHSRMLNGERIYCNLDGTPSKKQPSPYFVRIPIIRDEYDRGVAMRRAGIDFDRIQMLRSGKLEMSKTPNMFNCPGCPVRDACELHETGGDWEGFLGGTMDKWEPYAEHEIYDGR